METGEFRFRNIPADQWEKFKAIVREESVRLGKDYWPNDALLELIDQVVKRGQIKEIGPPGEDCPSIHEGGLKS